ncbi:MAG: 3-deoxy-D-manno-octulosonic acid transferase [Rhodobacteraceae bacterium]|nr:MAG: 3-deoxy-D-manno-octulosonic acid transferase [Paracoccaceae bacterium]
MGRSVSLAAYMLFSRFGEGWFARKLDTNPERRGIASIPRPDGPLIWINATSVSGADAILALCRRLLDQNPTLNCLITTKTNAAAQALQGQMPARMIHQCIPVDANSYVTAFLDHWKPDLSIWTEAEFQPAFVVQTERRNIPTIYIDASMSAKSFNRYRLFSGMTASLLQRFDHILTRDASSKKHLQNLGAPTRKTESTGPLSGSTPPLPHDETQRKAMARAIGGRPVWLAAHTHEGEEDAIMAAHKMARRSYPELLLILAPRRSERGDTIADMLREQDCIVAQRSKSQQIDRRTDVYIADTPNEMGLWYRLAPVSFIGGSLIAKGGHNPLPAAALGSAILHGPQVSDFASAYDTLLAADACIPVADGPDLAKKLEATLSPERAAQLATAAWGAFGEGDPESDRVFELLQSYFPKEAA